MPNSTTQRKKAQMASALFNDVQLLGSTVTCTAEFDLLSCDEQMRLEDLIATAYWWSQLWLPTWWLLPT